MNNEPARTQSAVIGQALCGSKYFRLKTIDKYIVIVL